MRFLSATLDTAGRWLRHAIVVSLLAPLVALWLGDQRSLLSRIALGAMLAVLLVATVVVALVLWVVLAALFVFGVAFVLLLSAGVTLYLRYRYHGEPRRYYRLGGRDPGSRL